LKTAEQTQIQCQNDIATQKQVIEDTCNSLKLNNIKKSELQENHQASVEKNNSSALSEIQTQIRTAVSSISSLKTTKESLWKQKQFYDSKPTCPTCGQDIDPKFVSSLDLDEKLSEIESEVAVLSKTLIDLEDRSAKIASEISIANKLDIELQNLCITIQHLETAKVNADKKIDSLTKNLETIDISISDMTKKRLEFHDKIGIAKQNLRHDILLMKAALQICKREQMGMTAQLATMAELGKNQSKRITAIIAEIEQLNRPSISFEDEEDCKTKKVLIEDQIEQTKKKLFYISTIKKMLSDTGIRKFILRRYVPIMNGLVNKYLNLLGAKYQIAFDEEMNEKIIARGYEELGLGNLSGGQIQRVDLALMFAFLEMAKMRNSVRTNLIFFDEILDMSLDADGLDGVFTIFNTLKQLGYTLYVISHRPEMTNKFDSVLTINMKTFSEVSKA
jgi:DNA repair exonuclease SbcCD ATPase subunit